jgi:hypothetical protein
MPQSGTAKFCTDKAKNGKNHHRMHQRIGSRENLTSGKRICYWSGLLLYFYEEGILSSQLRPLNVSLPRIHCCLIGAGQNVPMILAKSSYLVFKKIRSK